MSDAPKPKDGGPAFPCGPDGGCGPWPGMTLRDWFAGQVMAGIDAGNYHANDAAETAYATADAMLKVRNQ